MREKKAIGLEELILRTFDVRSADRAEYEDAFIKNAQSYCNKNGSHV